MVSTAPEGIFMEILSAIWRRSSSAMMIHTGLTRTARALVLKHLRIILKTLSRGTEIRLPIALYGCIIS